MATFTQTLAVIGEMVNEKESIKTFKEKFLNQGIDLCRRFDRLIGESLSSVYYERNWKNEAPLSIENGECHHIPYNGIRFDLESGKSHVIFDSNDFSDYGGTFGIDICEIDSNEIVQNLENQTNDKRWKKLINQKINSVKIIWLDDDGWRSPKKILGMTVIVPDKKSQGIFPHGIEMTFNNGERIYILAVEPDEFITKANRYKYRKGGEEFIIAFNEQAALNQKLIIEGIDLLL